MKYSLKVYARLAKHVKPYALAFALAVFGNLLYAAVDAGFIKFLEPLLNKGFVGQNLHFIQIIPYIVVAIFVIRGLAGFCSLYFMGYVGRKVIMDFRVLMFDKLLKLPAKLYDKFHRGDLISKLTFNVERVADAVTDSLTTLVRESATAVALLVVMLSISSYLTLLLFITIPCMALLMHFVSVRSRTLSIQIQNSMGGLTHVVSETIEGYKVVRLYGGEKYENKRAKKAANYNRQQEMKLITTNAIGVQLVQLIGAFALALIIYLATNPKTNGAITPGGFTAMMAAMLALLKPIKQLTKVNAKIQRGLAGAISIFNLLDLEEEHDKANGTLKNYQGDIVIKNLSFTYPGTKEKILDNLNLTIKPKETIAIVGKSGSGKSTLVNLLARLYDYEGEILFAGIDIKTLSLHELRKQLAYVSQNITLFNDTIYNNIAYGEKKYTKEQVYQAASLSFCQDFIDKMPDGYKTIIGENGLRLSGGQRQRIGIARAIIKGAPILIMDEATSNLDAESEDKIGIALEGLMHKTTAIIVAHRLSTIQKADKILVMEDGKIIEIGNHQELLSKSGHYANLIKLQYAGQAS